VNANAPAPELHKMTLTQIAEVLERPSEFNLNRKPGRTLPNGCDWSGHDIPGRGKAAARRLRQLERRRS
jgi:hypothetical protein